MGAEGWGDYREYRVRSAEYGLRITENRELRGIGSPQPIIIPAPSVLSTLYSIPPLPLPTRPLASRPAVSNGFASHRDGVPDLV